MPVVVFRRGRPASPAEMTTAIITAAVGRKNATDADRRASGRSDLKINRDRSANPAEGRAEVLFADARIMIK